VEELARGRPGFLRRRREASWPSAAEWSMALLDMFPELRDMGAWDDFSVRCGLVDATLAESFGATSATRWRLGCSLSRLRGRWLRL
jgi:hypothetical protein